MGWLLDPWDYGFMQRAAMELAIVGVLCGVVGCFVVLRGLSFIGDALAHAVFPGVIISYISGWSIRAGALVFGLLTAAGIAVLARNRRVSEDSAIGILFAAFFAVGVVLISRQAGFRRDLGSLLFGNVLGVSNNDVWVTLAIGGVILLVVFALLKEFTLVAFDSTMARSVGYPVFLLDLLLLLLVAATIVVSLQAVGNVLILALVITPASTARLLTDRLGRMLGLSAVLGAASGLVGLLASYHADSAAGGTIVLTATAFFLLALLLAPNHGLIATWLQGRRGRHHAHHFHPPGEAVAGEVDPD